ncbi:MAG: Glycosyl transferase group 1 [uncultured bacterium]|nr:MAG: Glycosyl transferase group 1 [uncultured bacterium]
MPALEAQACGTPLLCSDIPALREVSGNGAAYVSTDNHEEWSALMHRVTSDEAFANNLRELGAANCVKFSWEQTAKKTLSILLNQQYAKTDTRT